MKHLRVIDGGRALVPCNARDIVASGAAAGDDLGERVRRAEDAANLAAELVAPGVAIVCKSRAELMRMIAAVDLADAVQTHAAFKEAVAGIGSLLEMFRAAEIRLAVAVNAVAREGLTEPDDD
jgi:hypothetical protein